jgi:hypothetical protein
MTASTLVACKLLTACCPLASQFPALLPSRDWIWFWISAVGVDTFGAKSAVKRANTVVEYWVTAIETVYLSAIADGHERVWFTFDKSIRYTARLYSPRGRSWSMTLADPRMKSNKSMTDWECLLTPSGTHCFINYVETAWYTWLTESMPTARETHSCV